MIERTSVNPITATTYTLLASDRGKWLTFSSGSATTVTVPSTLGKNFECVIQQIGAGQVTVSGATGVTVNNVDGFTAISGQYGIATLFEYATNTFVIAGNLA